ncbi:MAG: response regulator transcription factor [Pseudomonadales bacterium]
MRILLVDDDSSTAELIAECLTLEGGATVCIAGTGNEALRACLTFNPDTVLLDVELPDISGLELAPQITALCPDARVVVLSGLASNHGMNNLPPCVDAYLVKPIDFDVLHQQILR